MSIPLISYNLSVPNPTNNPATDVTPMQQNTNSIQTILGVDHFPFNTNFSGGHKQVNLRETPSPSTFPPTVGGIGWATLYSAITSGIYTAGELFLSRGGAAGIQITGPSTPVAANAGQTFLPGGIFVQWGKAANASSGAVFYPVPFTGTPFCAFLSALYLVAPTTTAQPYSILSGSLANVGFQWNRVGTSGTGGYDGFYWLVIGN